MSDSMNKYIRKQVMITNLRLSLINLTEERKYILNELDKIELQMKKHEEFLEELEDDEDG